MTKKNRKLVAFVPLTGTGCQAPAGLAEVDIARTAAISAQQKSRRRVETSATAFHERGRDTQPAGHCHCPP
jgi:hypothetical protein